VGTVSTDATGRTSSWTVRLRRLGTCQQSPD
jgi:hypothetical protein